MNFILLNIINCEFSLLIQTKKKDVELSLLKICREENIKERFNYNNQGISIKYVKLETCDVDKTTEYLINGDKFNYKDSMTIKGTNLCPVYLEKTHFESKLATFNLQRCYLNPKFLFCKNYHKPLITTILIQGHIKQKDNIKLTFNLMCINGEEEKRKYNLKKESKKFDEYPNDHFFFIKEELICDKGIFKLSIDFNSFLFNIKLNYLKSFKELSKLDEGLLGCTYVNGEMICNKEKRPSLRRI